MQSTTTTNHSAFDGLDERILDTARSLYDPVLPYHNFDHALTVLQQAEKILDDCRQEQVPVNGGLVRLAILFHDAGYHKNHKKLGYATKEVYSAALTRNALEGLDYDQRVCSEVEKIILATSRDAPFVSNEEKVVRAADLAGVAGEYEDFLAANRRLWKEHELLTGRTWSWKEWIEESKKLLNFYLAQDIRWTNAHDDQEGQSRFHSGAQENLERLIREPEPLLH